MERQKVLLIDSAVNVALAFLLITFPEKLVNLLGIPTAEHSFYPSILGAVLLGIGVALIIEYSRRPDGLVGLGLGGAVTVNLCGGVVLTVWLLSGKLDIPFRGQLVLWLLAIVLTVISGVEIIVHKRSRPTPNRV
ncbi:MAG: hypothetical protein PVJ11_05475 [Syntrophobacterales bacterium]|jgi:riboflavin transporter FmnP